MNLFPRRVGMAAAMVIVATVLAGGLAIRFWRSATPDQKQDVVQQGGANATGRTPSDELKARERLTKPPNKERPREPKRERRAWRLARGLKLGPARPEPARTELVEQIGPAPAITAARRAKPPGNATLRNPETSEHLRQTQLLLRSFRNTTIEQGAAFDLAYEKRLSRELLSKNRLLRRRAENKEDSQAEELLGHLEPLLLDIAHLPDKPSQDEVRSVKELIREQKIIATLQIYSARAGY